MSLAPFLWLANPLWIRGDTWRRDRIREGLEAALGSPEELRECCDPGVTLCQGHVCLFRTGEVSWRNPTLVAAQSCMCTKDFKIQIQIYF